MSPRQHPVATGPVHRIALPNGMQGYYVADIMPTREGDYQWTFVGSINEDQVNEKFDTADGKFNGVEPITSLQFPVTSADATQAASAAARQRSWH